MGKVTELWFLVTRRVVSLLPRRHALRERRQAANRRGSNRGSSPLGRWPQNAGSAASVRAGRPTRRRRSPNSPHRSQARVREYLVVLQEGNRCLKPSFPAALLLEGHGAAQQRVVSVCRCGSHFAPSCHSLVRSWFVVSPGTAPRMPACESVARLPLHCCSRMARGDLFFLCV